MKTITTILIKISTALFNPILGDTDEMFQTKPIKKIIQNILKLTLAESRLLTLTN